MKTQKEIDNLLEIAERSFKEHLYYLPLDLDGKELEHVFQVQNYQKPQYNEDTDSISLWGGGYIYVNNRWCDRVTDSLGNRRMPVQEFDLASIFLFRAIGMDNDFIKQVVNKEDYNGNNVFANGFSGLNLKK
jgi:hypothetical protein